MKSPRPARCCALLVEQQLDDRRRRDDAELARVELARLAQDLAQDVVADAARGLDLAAARAGRARLAQHVGERLARALARHLDQPELREAADGDLRAVARRAALRSSASTASRCSSRAMSMKSTMMMPPRLRSRSCRAIACAGLEVGLEDRVVEVARADEAAGVDVDRRQRLGLVDDQVAARLQVDAARERALDLLVDRRRGRRSAARRCSADARPTFGV